MNSSFVFLTRTFIFLKYQDSIHFWENANALLSITLFSSLREIFLKCTFLETIVQLLLFPRLYCTRVYKNFTLSRKKKNNRYIVKWKVQFFGLRNTIALLWWLQTREVLQGLNILRRILYKFMARELESEIFYIYWKKCLQLWFYWRRKLNITYPKSKIKKIKPLF